jgi:hypothetical protein
MADLDKAWDDIGGVLEKFAKAFSDLTTIEVTTIETPFELEETEGLLSLKPQAGGATPTGLFTSIDMLQADITYLQSPNLSPETAQTLQGIHKEHVALSQEIFRQNLSFVAETIQKLTNR